MQIEGMAELDAEAAPEIDGDATSQITPPPTPKAA
jgi:hypothetical protein